jgi:predicted phage-related endonuclease
MTEIDLESVRGHIAILRLCKRKIAEFKEIQERSRVIVEEAMGTADAGLLDGEMAVSWPTFKENRFDSKAFREQHPELWESYKVASEKRRFEVVDD